MGVVLAKKNIDDQLWFTIVLLCVHQQVQSVSNYKGFIANVDSYKDCITKLMLYCYTVKKKRHGKKKHQN